LLGGCFIIGLSRNTFQGFKAMGVKSQGLVSRTESLRGSLLKLCESLGPGAKMPTVRSICSQFGTSSSTLDRVLEELAREGRIVRRHGSGVYVAERKKANTIALVSGVDPFSVGQSPFYPMICELLRKGVIGLGREFKFYLDPHFEAHGMRSRADFLKDMEDGLLLGALFIATAHPEIFPVMNAARFPYVAMTDCALAQRRFHVDAPSLVELGVRELAKAGRKRLCLLTWDGFGSEMEKCHAAFKSALSANGLKLSEGAIWTRKAKLPDDDVVPRPLFGARAFKELFASGPGAFDGMVCTDDMLCSGALSAMRDARTRPLVATHANKGSPVLALEGRGLIRLQVDTDALAADAVAALDALLDGEDAGPFSRTAKVEVLR